MLQIPSQSNRVEKHQKHIPPQAADVADQHEAPSNHPHVPRDREIGTRRNRRTRHYHDASDHGVRRTRRS